MVDVKQNRVSQNKSYQIAYYNIEPRIVSASKEQLQKIISLFADVRVIEVNSLDDSRIYESSLLVINAMHIDEADFQTWVMGLAQRMQSGPNVWTPGLIFAQITTNNLVAMMPETALENWYFDVVIPEESVGLPIRCANLLKIHDHLKELWQYNQTLSTLQKKYEALEEEVLRLSAEKT